MNALRYLPFAARGLRHSGPPLHLTLFVTGACNLRCRHCFHWKEVAEGVPGPSVEQVESLARSVAKLGPLLWVSFGGGEPFLRKDLPQLARAFGERGLRHLAIPTNGLVGRMEESVERMALENPDTFLSVSVSFDGNPRAHDEIRQIQGGHEKSCDAVQRLKAMQERHPNLGVGILVTVTSENQAHLADHLEELTGRLEPDNVTVNLARGTALDESLLQVDLERYREVVERKLRLRREGRLPYFEFPLAGLAAARDELMYDHVERVAAGDLSKHLPCTAGSMSAVIFEDGSVQPCEILGKSIGNLNDHDWDLSKLWKAKQADDLRAEIKRTKCACTWECAQADNVLFNARSWPKLLRATLSK